MKYVIWGLGLAVIGGTPVSAQGVADGTPVTQPEDALVVTANRTREKRENVASSMEVVTEAQLDQTVGVTFLDQLKKNAGLDVIQYPNGLPGIGLRGLRPDFEFTINPRTLDLVDGRPSGSTSFTTISPESIARVEVLKGPASALYGASAVGGVVNIITRRSSGPLAGSFNIGGGSFETIRSGMRLGGDLVGGTDFDLELGYVNQMGNFRLGGGEKRPNSDFSRASGRLRVGSNLGPIVRIDGSVDFADLDNDAPGPRSFNPQSRSATGTNRVSGDIRVEITPQDHAIRLVAYASREDYTYFEVPAAAVRYQSNNTVTTYRGAQLQDSWQVFAPLRLTYGFDWQKVWADRLSYNANGTGKAPSSPNESRETKAVFAEAGLNLFGERVILTAGGRYDWLTVATRATPFRANVKLGAGFRAHGTIGRAFVPAQAIQLAGESEEFAGIQRRVTFGNADLKPERNTTWDAGLGFARGLLSADVTYFDARTRNRITTAIVSETPTLRQTSYINSDKSRMRGIEGQFALDAGAALGVASGRFSLNGSVTRILKAEDILPSGTATPIRNVANWKATGSATVNAGPVSGTVTVRYNGDRLDTDNSQGRIFTNGVGGLFTYDRFTTVDFSGRWRMTPKDTLRLEVANAFDINYYEKADYAMPGRTLYARYVRSL